MASIGKKRSFLIKLLKKIQMRQLNKNKIPQQPRVFISLTSIKSREKSLFETVSTLVNQDYPYNYEVRLYLSHEPYLLDEGFSHAPSWINELKNRNKLCSLIVKFVSNTGPYRKLLPILGEYFNGSIDPLIITCDDDTQYSNDWLRTLIRLNQLTGGLVAFRGHSVSMDSDNKQLSPYREWQSNPLKKHLGLENIPIGKDGIIYRPKYFSKSVLNISKALEIAPTSDDLWFRWHSIIRGVPCYLIDLGDQVFDNSPSFKKELSLWEKYNKKGGNDKTIKKIEIYFQNTLGINVADTLSAYHLRIQEKATPSFYFAQYSHSIMAAKQVRAIGNTFEAPESTRAIIARSYEVSRLFVKCRIPDSEADIDPKIDRGGLLYSGEAVGRFDALYGWMSRKLATKPLVSVVMTTYNSLTTLRWAVSSILSQDYCEIELIIVDDLSTDGTRELLLELRRTEHRIRIVFLKRNRGTYFAKNVGLLRARGEIVTFQDSDDWSHPARIRLQVWRLLTTGAVATRCTYVRHHASLNQLVKVNSRIETPGFITLMTYLEVFARDGYFDCSRRAADDEFISRLEILHGTNAIDSFMLPAYVALYTGQSLIADSSEYSALSGLKFQLSQDRESYKKAYSVWHEQLRIDPGLKSEYSFPPTKEFIEKLPNMRSFEKEEISDLHMEIYIDEVKK